jgi:hypothetical protein
VGCAPLAPKELTRFFYWAWRALNTYRPKGQTSWSKALVRHGAGAGAGSARGGHSGEEYRDQRDRMSTSRL